MRVIGRRGRDSSRRRGWKKRMDSLVVVAEEDGEDNDVRSIWTIVPHELERVEGLPFFCSSCRILDLKPAQHLDPDILISFTIPF